MASETTTPDAWFALIERYAGTLRSAGVRRVELSGCTFDLDPSTPEIPAGEPAEVEGKDLLDDGAAYGRRRPPRMGGEA